MGVLFFGFTLYLLTLNVCQGSPISNNNDESAARSLMDEANALFWTSARTYRLFADDNLSPETLLREKLRTLYPRMKEFDYKNFENATLKRQFEVILRGDQMPSINFHVKKALATFRTMQRGKWACSYTNRSECNMAYVHQIKSAVASSEDPNELEYYWAEWRNKIPQDIKDTLIYYVQHFRNSTGSAKPSEVWYTQFEDSNFIEELTHLMEAIHPLYQQLHAHLRDVLRMKYGDSVIPKSGLIPHHLMEQVQLHAWKKSSVLKNPIRNRKLPNLQAELDGSGYDAWKIVNTSAEFFRSMGFTNFTEDFWLNNIRPMETGGPDCKSNIFDFGEVEIQYCPKAHFKKLLQTHADLTRVQYGLYKNKLPVGLNQEACPGFGDALGEAISLAASTPKHMQEKLHILRDYEYDDELSLNRLHRQGVHTLLSLPNYFVHEKLWVDMIDGKIQPNEYNCAYWKLMEEHAGVEPPLNRNSNHFDFPYKFYEGIVDKKSHTRKLVTEFLGYQIYRSLCMQSCEFVRGNAYKPLQNCDFSGNKVVGDFLKNMMAMGSVKSWRDVIKPLTMRDIPRIRATPFIEYYEPLHAWFQEYNAEKNLQVGWEKSTRCINEGSPSP